MNTQDNKTIAQRFLQAWSAGGQAIVDELAAPDITVFHSSWPAPVHGAQGFKDVLTQTFAFFPDMQITADDVLAEGDRVMVRWTYEGTHQHGELFGVAPSGKRVRVSGVTIYRIAGGKVIEENGIVDTFSLMLQVGAGPAPSAAATYS